MKEIGVGLLGLGNVGAGVVRLLSENADAIGGRLGATAVVRAIAVREKDKQRLVDVDPDLVTTDAAAVIDRDDIDIVCELVGGETDAKDYVLRAIERGKQVVTANKALLAVHGETLFEAAEKAGVDIYYEAAVCGGIPIIRALREGLSSDKVESFLGIVNGTSNYILSEMTARGVPFADVLAEAQERGYAEADPTLDVGGGDAAHKLAILATLCFGCSVEVDNIFTEGIDKLTPADFAYADRFGYVIKPLVIGRDHGTDVELRVHPTMVPKSWLLAAVPGAKNALYVHSYALGPSMYYGAGAGMMPTAMSVVSDIIEVCRNLRAGSSGALPMRSFARITKRPMRAVGDCRSRYFMRLSVEDRPGVLGEITTLLGAAEVSIAQVLQERAQGDGPVQVVVLTHEAGEGAARRAAAAIGKLESVLAPAVIVRVAES